MKAVTLMKIANAIKVVAKATRNRWVTYKYICMLNKAIETEVKEFRDESIVSKTSN